MTGRRILGAFPEFTGPALCAEVDTEVFYPEKGGSSRDAKRICGLCEVREECLDFAVDSGERFGIWGGLSERERRRLLAYRKEAAGRRPGTWAVTAERRTAVRQLAAEGRSTAEIAEALSVTERTVRRLRGAA